MTTTSHARPARSWRSVCRQWAFAGGLPLFNLGGVSFHEFGQLGEGRIPSAALSTQWHRRRRERCRRSIFSMPQEYGGMKVWNTEEMIQWLAE